MAQLLLSHINTLLFAILAMGVCVVILFLMLMPALGRYFLFFLVADLGLLVVVFAALAAIVNQDATKDTIANDNRRRVQSCPDYYSYHSNNKSCRKINELYNPVTDTYTQVELMDLVDKPCGYNPLPSIIDLNMYDQKTDQTICNLVAGRLATGEENIKNSDTATIKFVPWTAIRPFCPKVDPYPKA